MRYQEEEERQGQKMPAVSVVFVAYIRTFERIVIQLFVFFSLPNSKVIGRCSNIGLVLWLLLWLLRTDGAGIVGGAMKGRNLWNEFWNPETKM